MDVPPGHPVRGVVIAMTFDRATGGKGGPVGVSDCDVFSACFSTRLILANDRFVLLLSLCTESSPAGVVAVDLTAPCSCGFDLRFNESPLRLFRNSRAFCFPVDSLFLPCQPVDLGSILRQPIFGVWLPQHEGNMLRKTGGWFHDATSKFILVLATCSVVEPLTS